MLYGFTRENFGFFGKNFTTGEIIYPLHYKKEEEYLYLFDNFCYLANIGFLLFIIGMGWNVISNLKKGVTYAS